MAVWTVFEPPGADEAATTLRWAEGFVFVPERTAWSALLLAPLVLLRHRLWAAFIVYALVQAGVAAAVFALDLGSSALALLLVANLAVAVQLAGLRSAKLAARGYEEAGTVVAPRLDAAEQRYFDARLAAPRSTASTHSTVRATGSYPLRRAEPAVLGLFPEAGR
ncbi:DUF2628 domain-containing protein [Starkeya koreensis]|uniref:DUF2628 domain-containing protein n=1 Tax=Ancylobacter koreensis TaxID=266121 RepID=A0ABT0DHN5_9HYPH|nr:DUF2628 domain-containing protein [Ancylobacter koreensis]MCK0206798.1 DUF2628 domain-containing protein [Ancylobacter koreensis]